MIGAIISATTQAKLRRHVDIAILILVAMLANLPHRLLVAFPWRTAIDAFDFTRLALSPLLKTRPMDIVSTCSFTPENILASLKFHNAYRAVALDGLALASI
jgi:hypothetical protein